MPHPGASTQVKHQDMFKKFRVALLLFVLLNVALGAWLARSGSTSWDKPLEVIVYAINGDGSEQSSTYINDLLARDDEEIDEFYADIEQFFEREGARYGLALEQPVDVIFAGELATTPPLPPRGGSVLSVMLWSLKLRFWAWREATYPYTKDVEIFVLFFDPDQSPSLAHSLGLKQGLIGVVNAFASKRMRADNHVIIAHELLHTLGATDKYDPVTNLPAYPLGYAEPELDPLWPQNKAEIMAGRIAISEHEAKQAERLKQTVVGSATAAEIRWTKP